MQKNQELQELIEEVNRTQQQLIHSEKLAGLGQLVAGIAHELNNPIGFIYANLFQIRKYLDGHRRRALDDRGRNLLRKIDQALRESQDGSIRIRDIVQNLRGLSRAGSPSGDRLAEEALRPGPAAGQEPAPGPDQLQQEHRRGEGLRRGASGGGATRPSSSRCS